MIDPTVDKYLRGKIYKLVSDRTEDIYVGSTTEKTLAIRLCTHISGYKNNRNFTTAVELLKYDDVRIELIEIYPSTDRCMLEEREGYWVEQLKCVNHNLPGRTPDPDKYQRGKIYKLVSDQTDDIYIGSTTQTLPARLANHKGHYNSHYNSGRSGYMTSFKLLAYTDVKIVLLETYPTISEYFLLARERHWIETLTCINKNIPTQTGKEWRVKNAEHLKAYKQTNKEKFKIFDKAYRERNKEKHKEQRKKNLSIRVQCDICNADLSKGSLLSHKKLKHQEQPKKNIPIRVQCDICNLDLNKGSLLAHKKLKHPT